jgi:hypothetical protein
MASPIEFLMANRKVILEQYRQNDSKPKKAWESLQEILPPLSESMSFNTFKQYVSVFVGVTNGLDKVIQSRNNLLKDLKKTTKQKAQLESQVDDLKVRLDKVIQTDRTGSVVIQGLDRSPKRISGWNVQKSKDGYYRCYRKIAKRVHSIYIGKNLDLEKARDRIAEKEKKLGLW